MTKQVKWLIYEIDRWVTEGIISAPQAKKIKGRYTDSDQGVAWSKVIFLSIGAILIGLGIILFFAYNWQKIPKFAKLAVVFSSLIAAHVSGFMMRRSAGKYMVVGEGLHVLGTMIFGSGIWLIAQIYHIDEHYPTVFLIWGLGATFLAWALPSIAHGIIAAILLVLWNSFEAFDFLNPNYAAPFITLFAVLPLAWLLRSKVLYGIGVLAYLLALAFTVGRFHQDMWIAVLCFNAALLIGAGMMMEKKVIFPEGGHVQEFIGSIAYVAILYAFTFPGFGDHVSFLPDRLPEMLFFFGFAAAALAIWAVVVIVHQRVAHGIKELLQNEQFLVLPVTLLVLLIATGPSGFSGWGKASLFNIIFLAYCILLILRGCKASNLRIVIIGCVLLAVLTMSRFADLFESLLTRSIVFLLLGAALFGVGIYYSRSKGERQERSV